MNSNDVKAWAGLLFIMLLIFIVASAFKTGSSDKQDCYDRGEADPYDIPARQDCYPVNSYSRVP